MSKVSISLAATLLWAAVPGAGRAAVIFNTFGPNGSFSNEGLGIELFNGPLQQEVLGFGARFTPTGTNFSLDQISLPLGTLGGSEITLKVMTDYSGQPRDTLESFEITGIGGGAEIFTVNSVLHPLLVVNQPYFLVGFIPSANLNVAWYGFPASTVDVLAHGPYLDGHWDVIPNPLVAFSVSGNPGAPAPEPASGFVSGVGLVCLLAVLMFRGSTWWGWRSAGLPGEVFVVRQEFGVGAGA